MTDQEIVDAYVSGYSFKKLIVVSGKSLNYIRKRLRDAGVKHRPMGLPKGYKVSEARREQLRELRKGKTPSLGMRHTDETRRKMSESRKGSMNSRWIDGRKQTPYPPEWTRKLRQVIRERQSNLCALCSMSVVKNMPVHHIDHNKLNCREDNLVAVCVKCHGLVHRKRLAEGCRRVLVLYVLFRDAEIQYIGNHS